MARTVAFILLLIFAGSSANFPDIPNPKGNIARDTLSYRLPTDTVPIAYDIIIEPTFDPDFTFDGIVSIEIEVKEATNQITLHGKDLEINYDSVVVRELNDVETEYPLAAEEPINEDATMDFIHINLEDEVPAGTFLEVYIEYKGVLNEENTGFYRASYVENGETK